MNAIFKCALAVVALSGAMTASADDKGCLYVIGGATSYGWNLDDAQALLSTDENPSVFSGTIYLKGGADNTFKFMENSEWGGTEYGVAVDAASTVVSGDYTLASGSLDNGYKQASVAADGNYLIVVDTESLEASITLSDYQATEIKYCELYLVGNATPGGWNIADATPLRQVAGSPYEYKSDVALVAMENESAASFKIATALRGASSWDAKYFMFRDVEDAGKVSTDATDDRQWSVPEDGNYTVCVNTVANTISIVKSTGSTTSVDAVVTPLDGPADGYYDLHGCKVDRPANGVFIEVRGTEVRKVILK